jgi:hypothetical protein
MKKSVLVGGVVSLPLLAIAVREAMRLVAGLSDPQQAGAAPLLWIFGVFVTLALVWGGVFLIARAKTGDPARLPFEAVAAMAIAEARKRAPSPKCPKCARTRVSEKVARCLYCGAAFATSEEV